MKKLVFIAYHKIGTKITFVAIKEDQSLVASVIEADNNFIELVLEGVRQVDTLEELNIGGDPWKFIR